MSVTFTIARRTETGAWWHGHHDAAFNVHNAGACAILESLGIEWDYCGSHDAADVLARCVTWRATDAVAHGTFHASDVQGDGARMVTVGIDRWYVAQRIGKLEELARIAVAEGAHVGWS